MLAGDMTYTSRYQHITPVLKSLHILPIHKEYRNMGLYGLHGAYMGYMLAGMLAKNLSEDS